jgi:hypothetical protein
MIGLNELLLECADALTVPTWDHDKREEHVALIEETLLRENTPHEIRELLRSAAEIFREDQKKRAIAFAADNIRHTVGLKLAASIQSKVDCPMPAFIYHGTIYGRLTDILNNGLLPRKNPVWKEEDVPGKRIAKAVFFDLTWRGALGWAEIAHLKSKGRRAGRHRTPVVIRLSTGQLVLEQDPFATKGGCVMVRATVPVDGGHAILGRESAN